MLCSVHVISLENTLRQKPVNRRRLGWPEAPQCPCWSLYTATMLRTFSFNRL